MSTTLLAGIASASLSASVLFLFSWVISRRRALQLDARVDGFTTPKSVEEYELSLPFTQRFMMPVLRGVGAVLASRTPTERMNELRRKLARAGNPANLTAQEFMAIRVVATMLLGPGLGLFLAMIGARALLVIMALAVGGGIAFFYPNAFLKRKIKERQHSIRKALPDSIDLLTISMEAGLGFDLALKRITDKWQNPLSEEFSKVLTDIRLGRPRREALKDLVERTGVDDIATLVSAIIQAEQLGVGMVQVLRIQSEQLRLRRRQRAEEKAHKAPIKIIFPMVFFIFPAVYVVILGPAIPRILESFAGGG